MLTEIKRFSVISKILNGRSTSIQRIKINNVYTPFEKLEKIKRNVCFWYNNDLYAIPGRNANVKMILIPLPNNGSATDQWTQSSSKTETVENIIRREFNFEMTCSEFHAYVMGKPECYWNSWKSRKKYNISIN